MNTKCEYCLICFSNVSNLRRHHGRCKLKDDPDVLKRLLEEQQSLLMEHKKIIEQKDKIIEQKDKKNSSYFLSFSS